MAQIVIGTSSSMHPCLCVDEILRLVAHELVGVKGNRTAVGLACCCSRFEDPVLDVLWGTQSNFVLLLRVLPGDVWGPGRKTFRRLPTAQEWARLRKYARRMRTIKEYDDLLVLPSQTLSVLQLRALSEPLLPNLKMAVLSRVSGDSIPFVPLLLSPRTTTIHLRLFKLDDHMPTAASMIKLLPTLCPNLHDIRLYDLPKNPMITTAVSELVLSIKQNTIRHFYVDSPLTEEAHKVICTNADLCTLKTVIDEPTALLMVLPNLTDIEIEYNSGHEWLQGFCGASLGKLASFVVYSESDLIGDFLAAFESVTLTTSISETLSTFKLHTSCLWRPSYRSLLPFTQLKELIIDSECEPMISCSSTIDDDTITDLARAMPKLEVLALGCEPCDLPTGVTVKGLTALAHYCPRLTELTVHFQVASLDPSEIPHPAVTNEPTIPQESCVLKTLNVGYICVPGGSSLVITLSLLNIFPNLEVILYSDSDDEGWEKIEEAICNSKQLIRRSRPGTVLRTEA